jgi:hypothetical protein
MISRDLSPLSPYKKKHLNENYDSSSHNNHICKYKTKINIIF